jgi:hypothetical protein
MNLPDYPDGVLLENWVSRDDGAVFLDALCNQHTVKWIAMMHWELLESKQMAQS